MTRSSLWCTTLALASLLALASPSPAQTTVPNLPAGVTLPAREFDPSTEYSDPRHREKIADTERSFTAAVQARKDDEALTHLLWWWQNTTRAGRARWTASAKQLASRSTRARNTFTALRSASVPDPSMNIFADGSDTIRMNDWYWLHVVLNDEAGATQWFTQATRTPQRDLVLGFAALNNLPDIMSLALQNGASVNARIIAAGGATALMYAAGHPENSLQLVQLLLPSKPNVNLVDDAGQTALMWAMRANPRIETISTLLGAGAEPRWRDRRGRTALDLLLADVRTAGNPTRQQVARLLEGAEAQRNAQSAPAAAPARPPVAAGVPAPTRPPVTTPAYSPAPAATGPYGAVAGIWECRVDGFGGDGFTITRDGSVSFASSNDTARAAVAGGSLRFDQPGDGFFYTRRMFQFTVTGNEMRGTRVETARDRPAQTSQYVCGRRNLDGSVPAGTNVSAYGPSQEAWRQVADAALAILRTVSNQAAAQNLQRAIQSGQIRDEATLQATMALFLRDAERDPEMRPIIDQLRRMLPDQTIAAGPQVRGDTVGSSSGVSTGAASGRSARRPAAGPPAGMPSGPVASQNPGSQASRRDAQWRCGENSRCDAGQASVSIPELSSGRLALVNTDNRRVANMDFFWDRSTPSRSSRPDRPSYDVTLRMQAFNYSLCPVTVGGTVFVNGQTKTWFGSDAEPGLALAVNQSITRTYTITDVPQGATLVLRTASFVITSTCMP